MHILDQDDVEGMELRVIRGARKILERDQPAIVVEFNIRRGVSKNSGRDSLSKPAFIASRTHFTRRCGWLKASPICLD